MKTRPLLYLLVFVAAPLALGPLLAPWIYLGLQKLAAAHSVFAALAGDRFERVATRTVQIIALLLVWPCLRYSGTVARVAPALRWNAERGWCLLRWCGIGVATIAALYAVGFAVRLYVPDPRVWGTSRLFTAPLFMLIGAVLVGALEEYLFRGFIFGVLRARLSTGWAALLSSAFFSAIHFLRPRLPAPPEAITWTSGFELFPHLFTLFRPHYDWDFALTLFLMGLTLCGLLVRQGHLYGIVGLHIGWVWALQSGNTLLNQSPRHHNFWFGWGDNVAQGALATMILAAFAFFVWRGALRKDRDCHTAPAWNTTAL